MGNTAIGDQAEAQAPLQECDLVMKGGITSGIVYPPLILQLKDRYRFRAIGGTSAGAIAAAGAAAAEFGRTSGGFDKLHAMQQQLSQGTFLRDLFQPSARMAPVMNLALQAMDKRGAGMPGGRLALWLLGAALRQPWPQLGGRAARLGLMAGATLALVLTLLPAAVLLLAGGHVTGLGVLLCLALLGLPLARAGAVLGALVELVMTDLPANGFGMCPGRADASDTAGAPGAGGKAPAAVLTDWLNGRINDMAGLAGRNKSLTFGDLEDGPADGKSIALRMFTSNLSQHQPYVLPFEGALFAFRRSEFLRYFPQSVVDAMVAAAPEPGSLKSRLALPPDCFFFPEPRDLPVIVATRMSLSFPVLLSALPLYTVQPQRVRQARQSTAPVAVAEADLQCNWFSDGGICSNFPIHFFDGWLPGRPTFGVNLTGMPDKEELSAEAGLQAGDVALAANPELHAGQDVEPQALQDIYLPKPSALPATEWIDLGGKLPRFLWSVFTTAQVYRDNDQAMLPSYRERIVQIRLGSKEGGLNLAMTPRTIQGVIAKGERAGQALLRDFDFDQHFWVRFRVLTKQLEAGLAQMRRGLQSRENYPQAAQVRGYPFLPEPAQQLSRWCEEAQMRLTHLDIVLQQWEASEPPQLFAMEKSPIPEAVLRVTPRV